METEVWRITVALFKPELFDWNFNSLKFEVPKILTEIWSFRSDYFCESFSSWSISENIVSSARTFANKREHSRRASIDNASEESPSPRQARGWWKGSTDSWRDANQPIAWNGLASDFPELNWNWTRMIFIRLDTPHGHSGSRSRWFPFIAASYAEERSAHRAALKGGKKMGSKTVNGWRIDLRMID